MSKRADERRRRRASWVVVAVVVVCREKRGMGWKGRDGCAMEIAARWVCVPIN